MTEEEEFLPRDHPIQLVIDALNDKFDGGGDQALKIYLFWGVKDIDKEGGVYWDSSFVGEGVMDPDFDLSPEAAQSSILQLCQDLRKQEFVQNEYVKCWLEDF